MQHRRAPYLTVAAVTAAFVVGGATAPATAGAAKLTKRKVEAIAAKVVDEKAPTLKVGYAATAGTAASATTATRAQTAGRADTAGKADTATTAGDSALLNGSPASTYRNQVISINTPQLRAAGPSSRLQFVVNDLPQGVSYLLHYDLAFSKSDPDAVISCFVGGSNPVTNGSTSGNGETTGQFVSGGTVTGRSGNREPQITCDASAGTIQIAIPQGFSSTIDLLRIDDFSLGTATATAPSFQRQ